MAITVTLPDIISNTQSKDCLECRIVGGTCLLGAAIFVAMQAKHSKTSYGRTFIKLFSLGLGGFGVARLLNLKLPSNHDLHSQAKDLWTKMKP